MSSGLLQMLIWARADALDFNLLQDMVDHQFVYQTRPARLRDLALYIVLILIPFFLQVVVPNDPVNIEYA